MNVRTAVFPAILAALALTRPVAGQGPAQAPPPAVVPVEREPQHHPVFRNDVLAVIDVQFPPGYTRGFVYVTVNH